jgi:integrase
MRAGELADLEADAVVQIGAGHWLRIPLGKLRNDRYVPLHPELVRLLAAWTAANLQHIRRHKRLVADHRGPLDRHVIGRIVRRTFRACTRTGSATRWPPRRSTGACGWKPSPPCSATARWR